MKVPLASKARKARLDSRGLLALLARLAPKVLLAPPGRLARKARLD